MRSYRIVLGLTLAALIVGVPLSYAYYRQTNIRNLHAVRDGVLYRSGQLSIAGLRSVVHDYGIRTVITLRDSFDPNDPPPDLAEENFCLAEAIRYVRISPRTWWAPAGEAPPARPGVDRFLEVMKDPSNYPVLIHCYAGIHRTGAFCAVYRMEIDHWSNKRAIDELMAAGYRTLPDDWDLLEFLETFQPTWMNMRSQ
jgi:tyrosine-protein phosphatase SIW14